MPNPEIEQIKSLEIVAGEIWEEIYHVLQKEGIKLPDNFDGIGIAYGCYTRIGNILDQREKKLIEEIENIKTESALRLNTFTEGHKSGFKKGIETCLSIIKKQ